jgi:flavin reductase (DIM6/NTAB) family NADH-FMN oxidoreductase RutF
LIQVKEEIIMSKLSISPQSVFSPQPVFLVGTYNEDGTPNFAPITWVSYTFGPPHCIVISMAGKKLTKDNIFRTGMLSVNLASTDMLDMVDYFGMKSGYNGIKDELIYEYADGKMLKIPVLEKSKWTYECQVSETIEMSETHTYLCEIKNILINSDLADMNLEMIDLRRLDPVIYAGYNYFNIGKRLGACAEFYTKGR